MKKRTETKIISRWNEWIEFLLMMIWFLAIRRLIFAIFLAIWFFY
jgi:hypothetical protein